MAYMKKAATEGVQIFEWLARRHRDGMLFWVEVNLRSVQLGGRDCLIAVARDISLEKEARQALDNQQAHLEENSYSRARPNWRQLVTPPKQPTGQRVSSSLT